MKYIIPIKTSLCRYGEHGSEWIFSTKEVLYTDKNRLQEKTEIYKAIKSIYIVPEFAPLKPNTEAYLWFRTSDKRYPVFAVKLDDVKWKEDDDI